MNCIQLLALIAIQNEYFYYLQSFSIQNQGQFDFKKSKKQFHPNITITKNQYHQLFFELKLTARTMRRQREIKILDSKLMKIYYSTDNLQIQPIIKGKIISIMEIQKPEKVNPKLIQSLSYPQFLLNQLYPSNIINPILNKIITKNASFYCGYSDGRILQYSWDSFQHLNTYNPYQNSDVIDMQIYDEENILTCTHTQLTLYNMVKNKSLNLKGHQQTIISLAAHPFSPLTVSVSNLIVHHDLRMKKPINVNFVTPPVYHLEYFPDGQYYLLSGEPCRIGKSSWMRTLLNGMGTVSHNGKYILVNQMNSKIRLWNWRTSEIFTEVTEINNTQNYQPIYYGLQEGKLRNILFLEDDGNLFQQNLLNKRNTRHKLVEMGEEDNWKMIVKDGKDTNKILVYEHSTAAIKCFQI